MASLLDAALLNKLVQALQKGGEKPEAAVTGAFGSVGANLTRSMDGLKEATTGLGQVFNAIAPGLSTIGAGIAGAIKSELGALGKNISSGIATIFPPGGRIREALGGVGEIAGGVGKAVVGAGGAVAGVGTAAAGGVASFTASLATAAAAPIGAFAAMTAASYVFVNALNPSALLVFNQALRDLTAVIGVALEPIIQVASGVLRELGATLLPVMAKLRPIIEQIASAFSDVLMVSINALGSILTSLMPAFEFLAGAVKALVPVFQAVSAYLAGWVEVLVGIFRSIGEALGISMKDVTGGLRTAFETLSKYVLLAAAHMAVLADKVAGFFGLQTTIAKDFARGVTNALTGGDVAKQQAEGLAAAQNAQVGGIADFTRTLATAAFLAGPAGGAKTKDAEEKAWRENVAKQIGEIAAGKKTDDLTKGVEAIKQLLTEKFNELIAAVKGAIYDPIFGAPSRPVREVAHAPMTWGTQRPSSPTGSGGEW